MNDLVAILAIVLAFAFVVAGVSVFFIERANREDRRRLTEPPYIEVYQNGEWKKAIPKVYQNGEWRDMTREEVEYMVKERDKWSISDSPSED